MKTVAPLLILLALPLSPTRAMEIPEQLTQEAQKTFACRKPFFIWTTVPQPVVGRRNSATIPIKWAAKNPAQKSFQTTPFCLSAETMTVDDKGRTNRYWVFLGPFRNVKEGDDLRGFVGARDRRLVTATVVYSLIPVEGERPRPEPVSNAVEVKVEFRER